MHTYHHGHDGACALQVCTSPKVILSEDDILQLIGTRCDGVIGQVSNHHVVYDGAICWRSSVDKSKMHQNRLG